MAVAVDVLAEVFFEGFEQCELQLLDFVELRFEPVDSIFERGGAGLLIGNLTLLDQVPEEAHGCCSARE